MVAEFFEKLSSECSATMAGCATPAARFSLFQRAISTSCQIEVGDFVASFFGQGKCDTVSAEFWLVSRLQVKKIDGQQISFRRSRAKSKADC